MEEPTAAGNKRQPTGGAVELPELRKMYSEAQLQEANVEEISFDQLMDMSMLSHAQVEQFRQAGFLVVPEVLTEGQCQIAARRIIQTIDLSIFEEESYKLNDEYGDFRILLGSSDLMVLLEKPDCLRKVKPGSTKKRLYFSKRNGHWNLYWLPELQTIVNSNPKIYTIHRQLYNNHRLRGSINRVGIKPPGSIDMKPALDRPLFGENTASLSEQLARSIKAIVCLVAPTDVPSARESGSYDLVESFHHYFELAREFFHPHTGVQNYRFPVSASGKLSKTMAAINLDVFNTYIQMYTHIQANELPTGSAMPPLVATEEKLKEQGELWLHALSVYHGKKPIVPQVAYVLRWTTVQLMPGNLLVRDARVPYRTLRNKSGRTPFLFAYCNMSAIKDEAAYSASKDCTTIKKCQKDTIGAPAGTSNDNEVERRLVEKYYRQNYSLLFTYDGNYTNFRQDNLLSKVLYGYDFRQGSRFTWSSYEKMSSMVMSLDTTVLTPPYSEEASYGKRKGEAYMPREGDIYERGNAGGSAKKARSEPEVSVLVKQEFGNEDAAYRVVMGMQSPDGESGSQGQSPLVEIWSSMFELDSTPMSSLPPAILDANMQPDNLHVHQNPCSSPDLLAEVMEATPSAPIQDQPAALPTVLTSHPSSAEEASSGASVEPQEPVHAKRGRGRGRGSRGGGRPRGRGRYRRSRCGRGASNELPITEEAQWATEAESLVGSSAKNGTGRRRGRGRGRGRGTQSRVGETSEKNIYEYNSQGVQPSTTMPTAEASLINFKSSSGPANSIHVESNSITDGGCSGHSHLLVSARSQQQREHDDQEQVARYSGDNMTSTPSCSSSQTEVPASAFAQTMDHQRSLGAVEASHHHSNHQSEEEMKACKEKEINQSMQAANGTLGSNNSIPLAVPLQATLLERYGHHFPGMERKHVWTRPPACRDELADLQEKGGCVIETHTESFELNGKIRNKKVVHMRTLIPAAILTQGSPVSSSISSVVHHAPHHTY